jgi:hypothetical protein
MTDPLELEGDSSGECNPCLQDFDLYSKDIAKDYGDKI